tara:strand:- start:561 stop:734 length:174 start_codon:yes stop_codon:yes gene_type:complete
MKKFIFLIFVLTASCSSNVNIIDLTDNFNISEKMSFEQIINKFEDYAENSNYPSMEN